MSWSGLKYLGPNVMLWNFKRKWFSIRTFSIRTLIWKLVDHAQNYKWSSHSGQYVACWLGSFSSPKNTEHLKFVYKNTLSILRKCNCYQSLVYWLYYVLFSEMGKFHVEIHLYMRGGYNISSAPNNFTINNIN